jgi:hypothetical protein
MITDEVGKSLHSRAVRGESLTPDEQAQLSAWYARLDREEEAMYAKAQAAAPPDLDARDDLELAEILVKNAEAIRDLIRRNRELSQEVAALRRELVRRTAASAS